MRSEATSSLEGFVAKLERRTHLPAADRAALVDLPANVFRADAQDVVAKEGEASVRCLFVVSGFLTRRKRVKQSSQIVGLGIGGDAIDLQSLWFQRNDHDVVAQTNSILAAVKHEHIARVCAQYPTLARMLWHDTLVDAAIFREWTLNIGHRRAADRIAHFVLEIATRLRAHGIAQGDEFDLPMTQGELASALGLSLVHTNKSLKLLKDCRRLVIAGRTVQILDREALERQAAFDPTYLHIATKPRILFEEQAEST